MRYLGRFRFPTTPSAPLKEAARLLLDVASTPPMSGGERRAQFIHTFFDPAYRHYLDTLLLQEGSNAHSIRVFRSLLLPYDEVQNPVLDVDLLPDLFSIEISTDC
jgi:hypothetical protein